MREPLSLAGTLDFLEAAKAAFRRDKMLTPKERDHRCDEAERVAESYAFINDNREAFNAVRQSKIRSAT